MSGRKLWYILTLLAFVMLPLAGCGGSSGSASNTTSKDGYNITASGKIAGGSLFKSLFATATTDLGTITVINAQDGTPLATGPIDASGKFSNLAITLPTAKTVLVFKADVSLTGSPFRTLVPIDLSAPPAAGISASNSFNIVIGQDSTNIATAVSAMLGVTGVLGDTGATLTSVNKTFADVSEQVMSNGGQVLAYNTSGLVLTGQVSNASLLPAVHASTFTVDDLKNIALDGSIQSVFIPGKKPIVNFTVINKTTGKGISGLRTFALHIAKLVPETNGSNSYWQNYLSDGLPKTAMPALVARGTITPVIAATNPTTDAADLYDSTGKFVAKGYTVIDHGDGSYTATFGADVTANTKIPYDAAQTHRLGISVRNVNVPGGYAGPINPLTNAVQAVFTSPNVTNLIYDFTPSTGKMLTDATTGKQAFARDIVTADACAQCHYKLAVAVPNDFLSGHTGSRTDSRLCVVCHTSQIASGEGEMVTFIHRLHMGEKFNDGGSFKPVTGSLPVTYNEQTYPQDIRRCVTCHKGVDVDNWMSKPSQKSCGSCHNATDFKTHKGGLTDDSACSGCHGVGKSTPVAASHFPVTKAKNTSSGVTSYYATNEYLPTGAYKIEYVIDSVTVDATTRKPSVKFKIKKNGADVVFGTYDATTNPNIIPNTIGGPSIRIAYNNDQDGITSPLDTNAYMSVPALGMSAPTVSYSTATPASTFTPATTSTNLWANGGTVTASGITWTLTGPDGSGFYTVSGSVAMPANTTIVTALMYGAMTQTNVAGYPFAAASISDFTPYLNSATETRYGLTKPGLILSPPNALVSSKSAGFTARRKVIDNAKCLKCHDQLGIAANFHGGGRNDGTDCFVCHTENSANTGWSYGANTFIHAIHATSKRTVKYTFGSTNPSQTVTPTGYYTTTAAGTTATKGFFNVGYPGLLKNCEQCHVSGGYDFTLIDTSKLLPYTVGTGTTAAATYNTSPYIAQTAGTAYGSGFGYATTTGAVVTTPAAATTLVISPISAACFACHDTKSARAHMENEGGSIYAPRSSLKTELCTTCHGKADNVLNTTVPTVKAVHRWW